MADGCCSGGSVVDNAHGVGLRQASAAVDDELLAGEVGGFVRGQEGGQIADLLRLAKAAQGTPAAMPSSTRCGFSGSVSWALCITMG